MGTVKCTIKECQYVFTTTEPLSKGARFICRNHPRREQIRAVGRKLSYLDHSDQEDSFQVYAFDKDIRRAQ